MLAGLIGRLRFMGGIPAFLRETISLQQARDVLRRDLAERDASFLRLAQAAVYANPQSPFRRLLLAAGIGFEELRRLVQQLGTAGAAERLYDCGVFLTFEEFKGQRPVDRGGVQFLVQPADLANPALPAAVGMRTSGSSGRRSYAALSLDVVAREAPYLPVLYDAYGVLGSPVAIWGPPSLWALNTMLRHLKADIPVSLFYASQPVFASGATLRAGLALAAAALAARSAGRRIPWPRPAPPQDMSGPARWLAEVRRSSRTAVLNLPPAAAVRLVTAAQHEGLDISGAVFWNGSEPLTPAKAAFVQAAGVRSMNLYSQTELGIVGLGCADPGEADDLHIAIDRLMVISRPKQLPGAATPVPALLYTTTSLRCRTVMINVETGDYGRLEERRCGCPLGGLGFDTHLSGLRAYDRLTLRSLGFQGDRLYELVDELLPGRFGGHPGDYQLVEEETPSGALTLRVLASPRLSALDADAVAAFAAGFLAGPEGRALPPIAVERREPYLINGRKTPPLHRLAAAGSPRPGA